MGLTKVLLVEDEEIHANITRFPSDVEVTRVKTLVDATKEIYGVTESGYTDRKQQNPKGYEFLLTDLNFPIGRGKFGQNEIPNVIRHSPENPDESKPLGWSLIYAAAQAGIPKIGLYTDTNHHDGAVACSFEILGRRPIRLGNSLVCAWDIRTQPVDRLTRQNLIETIPENEWRAENRRPLKLYSLLFEFLKNPEKYLAFHEGTLE